MTRILVVDDDPPMCARMQRVAEQVYGAGVCTVVGTLAQARTLLGALAFDLVLLDVNLPDGSGVTLLPWIRQHAPQAEVVIVSSLGDDATVLQAIRAGAVGYLLKNGEDMEMELSLRSMQRGGAPIDPVIARRILLQLNAPEQAGAEAPPAQASAAAATTTAARGDRAELTERELAVLRLVAQGHSNREIAESLHVSINTIETHAKNIFRKLAVHNRSAAVHSAQQQGWLG
ncbi:response regulator transcription factor [Xenophilus arseniciresistens]|uniref:Response regulator transcription factor n=1 Tax=Xenophilus arseniciresistens TaxID=1283306 RepID=A0AAE3NB74_9BURK|nr:response regulator transcription factor [Xenophilus arseniciresistens]MDA7418441.1 response regulator transcription factor [Xenophilus arseniciresistens]